jgi:hypothetical protein
MRCSSLRYFWYSVRTRLYIYIYIHKYIYIQNTYISIHIICTLIHMFVMTSCSRISIISLHEFKYVCMYMHVYIYIYI